MQQPTEDTPTLDATAQAVAEQGEGAAQAPTAEGPGQARTFTQEVAAIVSFDILGNCWLVPHVGARL